MTKETNVGLGWVRTQFTEIFEQYNEEPPMLMVRRVPSTSTIDPQGRAVCVWCSKRLRWYINGYGYAGSGHFCNMKCAAEWGDRKVEGTTANELPQQF